MGKCKARLGVPGAWPCIRNEHHSGAHIAAGGNACFTEWDGTQHNANPRQHDGWSAVPATMLAERDAEIAALKAEVGSKNATIEATRRHVDRLRRALAAGPAAVRRQENVDVNTREAYARVVEVAQAEAMKEEP